MWSELLHPIAGTVFSLMTEGHEANIKPSSKSKPTAIKIAIKIVLFDSCGTFQAG